MAAKFVIFSDKAKKFRFRLVAPNGEIIATGESYESKASCLNGIKSIQKNAPIAAIIDETIKKEPAAKEPAKKAADKKPAKKTTVKEKADAVATPK
ncbi:MAG: YegP family protein [Treponema sp.]|nr:YegP family protein [Treponema sp.]